MAAISNGLYLHQTGLRAFASTFFSFTDYMRPSIRLAALSRAAVIYIMTHDSIALGEDGPTHQPIEHLASLRAMPNIHVIRPAECKRNCSGIYYCIAVQGYTVYTRTFSTKIAEVEKFLS
eukprot:jgi/Galph1/1408/GphlegSOOS_G99.1